MKMTKLHSAAAVLPIVFTARGASAIITKENPQQAIASLDSTKFFVSLFERGDCAGAVTGDNYVVTAAHCVCGLDGSEVKAIDYLNDEYYSVAIFTNPEREFSCDRDGPNSNDVAVVGFAGRPFRNHDARQIYSSSDEVGKTIWIMGMGIHGQPDDFANARACSNGDQDSNLREGYNTVEQAGGVLTYIMNPSSSSSSHSREAIAQDGDSGGPALIEVGGEWQLAGVNSGTNENNPCDWGSSDQYCRLSEHAGWIYQAMDDSVDDASRGIRYNASDGKAKCCLHYLAVFALFFAVGQR